MASSGRPAEDRDGEIDAICDRFEAAWKAGLEPVPADFLGGAEPDSEFGRRLTAELEAIAREYRLEWVPGGGSLAPASGAADAPTADVPVGRRPGDDLPVAVAERCGSTPVIPGYEIVDELGRGGMGIVYRAHQSQANRLVALKMILNRDLARPAELARFRLEAETVARLRHPHVVVVHEVGEHDGLPFFSMEYCPAGSLAVLARERSLVPREAARLVQQTAAGVAAAHAAGLVHRDLKPQNVLLTEDGTPKVSDFGLAKRLDESADAPSLTRTGDILGTPSFMAPEQAFGNAKGVGREADVYALGAVLYALLCGRPPFVGPSPVETLIRVVSEDPEPPRRLRPEIPRDLETICLKCLAKDPRKRYPTAAELAEDLASFLAGEPVSSARSGLLAQMAGALERVPLHERFTAYGTLLFLLAPVMMVPELLVTLVVWKDLPVFWLPVIQFSRVAAFVLAIGYARSWSWAPRGPVERLLYLVWGGYLACCFVTGLSYRIVNGLALTRIELNLYQSFATLAALAFFALSGTFWGHCLLIGLAFLGLAFVMAINPAYAALEYGVTWAVVLVLLGWRLRALARASES